MLKNKNALVGTMLLFTSLVAACSSEESQRSAPQAPAVTVVTLKSEPVTLTRELPGRTNAWQVAEVRPQVSGIVEKRLFTEGGVVEAGEPLYQLDDATYEADHASARAALQRAEASLHVARLNAERMAELVKTGAVSKQENDNAIAALEQAEADVAVAKANAKRTKVQLDYARISAPISGRIGKSSVTQGALVTANQAEPLATIRQLDPVYVDLTQSATELMELRKSVAAGELSPAGNLPVTILLEDGNRYEHQGKLAFSEVSVEPSTGSYLLRVVVPNPDHLLMPGMYVRAVVGHGVRENAVLVPQQGIARDPKGNASAMVVNDEGKVEARPVVVSRTVGNHWLVEKGLAAGDRVIIEGLQKIRPGAAVNATEASDESRVAPTTDTPTAPAVQP